jgi:two-component system, NtrC family, response regulator AtoC
MAALRAGAYDFITKPVQVELLAASLWRALERQRLREQIHRLSSERSSAPRFGELLGESVEMQALFELLERVADTDASVLITGETGTGKEAVARALHARSARRGGPFLALNCATLQAPLLESELFGHARGAFTDAKSEHRGLLVQASGGTLLLDEIGDLPLELQPKLLRALQERRVRPVGSSRETAFDARLVAATNQDLSAAVEERRFRKDLYFRLNVVQMYLPPLRTLGRDVLLLAEHFLEDDARRAGKAVRGLAEAVAERFLRYSWPGNVRELQNCIERAVAVTRHDRIVLEDLPQQLHGAKGGGSFAMRSDVAALETAEQMELRYIRHVLELVGGNKSLAARILGFDRRTLYRKLEQHGLG